MEKNNDIYQRPIFSSMLFLSLLVSFFYASECFAKKLPKKMRSYKETTYECKGQNCPITLRLFASVMAGGAWAPVGQSQSFVDDDTLYTYNANTGTQGRALWGASVGEELRFNSDWSLQVGLAYYQAAAFDAKGTITQGVDPASQDTYNYQYSVIARQYLFEAKFLGDMVHGFHPYFSLGIGAAFNSVNDYDVTVNSPFPFSTFTPEYPNYNNINFSYGLGVGVDYDVWKYARVGLGYRYAWFGNANTGSGEINTVDISQTLGQNNLKASMAILQLTFLI